MLLQCAWRLDTNLPRNHPVRLEQRNGRIDRHGQRASEVLVYHFVCEGYRAGRPSAGKVEDLEADLEFLMRAAEKVNTIREDLGKVGPVIAEQVEEAMLGRRAELNTQQAEKDAEPVRKLLKFERNLREQIARLYEQLQETRREQRLDPENVQTVVETALDLAGQPPLVPIEYPGIWPDPTGKYRKCPIFRLPSLGGSWALCSEGLAHPHTREIRPIVFDHDLAADNDKIVLVHLNHRLVQMSLALLRAEVWSHEGNKSLHRVTARLAPNAALDVPAIIAYARLVVTGSRGDRLHEELITAGGLLREGRFQRLNVGQMKDLLSQAEQRSPGAAMKKKLADLWPQHSGPLRQALEARMKDRVESLEKFLAERAKKEAGDIASVLGELERSIREELKDPAFEQLQLFGFEKDQAERDIDALRARLAEIPGEIVRETDAIQQRYASLTPRVFPAAVVYLVPERMA